MKTFQDFLLEGDAENWERERQESGKHNGTIHDKHGNEYHVEHKVRIDHQGNMRHSYMVHKPGNRYDHVASAETTRDAKSMMHIHTEHEHQRKGVMTALLNHAEKHLGHKLVGNNAQTPDGEAYWAHRNKHQG